MITFYRNKLFVSFLNTKINEKCHNLFTKSCIVFVKKQTNHLVFFKGVIETFRLYDAPHSILFQHVVSQMITHTAFKGKDHKVGLKNTTSETRSQFL